MSNDSKDISNKPGHSNPVLLVANDVFLFSYARNSLLIIASKSLLMTASLKTGHTLDIRNDFSSGSGYIISLRLGIYQS